jgi:(4S)-4-hydroxy-5-phosphonooxypentane-2,3-dione isomerase
MFVVTVNYEIKSEHRAGFRAAILKNARMSLRDEPGCHQFDVCFSEDEARCFLYEVYDDSQAFAAHRATPHFNEYDQTVKDWVAGKTVETWTRANDAQ